MPESGTYWREGSRSSSDSQSRALRERAYKQLSKAIGEAHGQLGCDWLRDDDPDLQSLRDRNESEWQHLVQRHCADEELPRLRRYPTRPWGPALRRLVAWIAALVITLASVFLVLLVEDVPSLSFGLSKTLGRVLLILPLSAIVASFLAWRIRRALREHRLDVAELKSGSDHARGLDPADDRPAGSWTEKG